MRTCHLDQRELLEPYARRRVSTHTHREEELLELRTVMSIPVMRMGT